MSIPNELLAKLHLMRAGDEALLIYVARDVYHHAEMSRSHAASCAEELTIASALLGFRLTPITRTAREIQ